MNEEHYHYEHDRPRALERHHGPAPERRQRGVYHLHRQRGWHPHPHTDAARRRVEERALPEGETVAVVGEQVPAAPAHYHQAHTSARHLTLPRGAAPLVEAGSIASYDAASGTALVRLAGAPARLIGPARVTACAPRDLALVGASCLTVLLDRHNPGDAVVVAVWPVAGVAAGAKLTQAGAVDLAVADESTASTTVTFAAPYAMPPIVVATSTDPAWTATVGDLTTAGFTLTIRAASALTGTVTVQWIACGA